jgi:hypothetical protein
MSYSAEPGYTLSFQVSKILEFLLSIPPDNADKEMIGIVTEEVGETDVVAEDV